MEEKNWKLRTVVVLALVVLAVVALLPTVFGPENLPKWFSNVNEGLNLGLDLKGGIHFVLSVDVDKAVADKAERTTDEIGKRMEDEGITFESVKIKSGTTTDIVITLKDDTDKDKFRDKIVDFYTNLKKISTDGNAYTLRMRDETISRIKEYSVDQALETLRSRIDELGLKEPVVAKQGATSILIQLPGYKDIERARRVIGQTAQLEFKLVADDKDPLANYINDLPEGITARKHTIQDANGGLLVSNYLESENRETLLAFVKDKASEGTEFLLEANPAGLNKTLYSTILVYSKTLLTGDMLTDARVNIDQQKNRPYVSMTFDREGARKFAEVTGENVKKRLAIVLDNRVNSAPVIQSKIEGGSAQITLNSLKSFNEVLQEAQDLALVLRAGSLPAPVTFEENRTVGPSLGADSIAKGKMSIIVGFVVVILFMMVYYGMSGFVADIALLLNILFIMGGMAMLGATLTFPGIAGIVLTIGMAVDANVIIFERIREELRLGRSVINSIESGYEKAWSAIFDANLTTALAAFVLWNFGSGPIKGFAITLLLGIISSMFTAIFVTRLIFQGFLKAGAKKISI